MARTNAKRFISAPPSSNATKAGSSGIVADIGGVPGRSPINRQAESVDERLVSGRPARRRKVWLEQHVSVAMAAACDEPLCRDNRSRMIAKRSECAHNQPVSPPRIGSAILEQGQGGSARRNTLQCFERRNQRIALLAPQVQLR